MEERDPKSKGRVPAPPKAEPSFDAHLDIFAPPGPAAVSPPERTSGGGDTQSDVLESLERDRGERGPDPADPRSAAPAEE